MSSTENNNENTEEEQKSNNVIPFIKDIIIALIRVIIIGFLGANFVFLTRVNLEIFFPSDVDQRPYTDKNTVGNDLPPICAGKKSDNGTGCGNFINICESKLLKNKYFEGMFDYGFPYTLESKDEDETFGGIITSWFANKVKYSYIWLRSVIRAIIEFSSSFCLMVPEQAKDIVPFILGPLCIVLLLLISSIWYLPSLVSVFFNEKSQWGMIFSIVGLFFGWTWLTPLFTSFVQIFDLMFKLILLPLMINPQELGSIMGNKWNAWYMKFLFLIYCIYAAFKNLQTIPAIAMTIVFIINMMPPIGKKSENVDN